MAVGLLGNKIGMTQIFDESGKTDFESFGWDPKNKFGKDLRIENMNPLSGICFITPGKFHVKSIIH